MYRRSGDNLRQAGVGVFRDGRWKSERGNALSGDLFWTVMVSP
jgi:hypothetical protein